MTQKRIATFMKTFDGDIYIIEGKTPDQIQAAIDAGGDMVRMPNGSRVHKKSFSTIQDYEDYEFQTRQKVFHKKGYHIKNGAWHDTQGALGIKAHLEAITGSMQTSLPQGTAGRLEKSKGQE